MITVFYDGDCRLCAREIKYYQRRAPQDTFRWLDIATNVSELKALAITETDALKQLHVVDEKGVLHMGMDAFRVIWEKLAYWKMLATVTSFWPLRPFLSLLYRKFAHWRFKRLYGKR